MADSVLKRLAKTAARNGRTLLLALALAPALAAVLAPGVAQGAACVCGTGKMTNWFPGTAPVTVDGDMSDWSSIQGNPNNNICDGSPATVLADLDAPIQSTGRDLEQFTYTFDTNYVYAYTKRYASDSNTDNFIYYADTNNDGLMETGEPVVVVSWQGSNRTVGVSLGTYRAYYSGGDPMVCTPGKSAGQSCTAEYADGYHLPGVIMNLPSAGHPNYSGTWGSVTGTEMEWKVSWADLGMASSAGKPFTFHVASTNSQPGAGSFPAQVDDNMGGCGGKGGTTQYAGVTITPNNTIALDPNVTYPHTYTANHTIINTGNGNDNFKLSYTMTGANSGGPSVSYAYNGVSFYNNGYDTRNISPTFSLAPGQSMVIQARYYFASFPGSNKSYLVTTTATSDFDANASTSPPAQDSLSSQEMITLTSNTVGGYGSFTYTSGSNGLPTSSQPLTLTTAYGNNPAVSPGYVIANPAQDATVTEVIAPGWVFAGVTCAYSSTSGTVSYTVDTTTTPGSVIVKLLRASFTGDNINCTFTNNLLPTIKAYKMLPVSRATDSDQFTINLNSGSTVIQSCRTTGSADQVAGYQASGAPPCPGPVFYKPSAIGVAYALSESSPTGYAPSLSCTNNTTPVSTPNTLGQSFTPTWGDNYVCYIVNTTLPVLTVSKKTFAGYGTFSFSGSNGAANNFSFSLGTTASNNPASSQSYLLPAMNTDTTVTENLGSGLFPAGWAVSGSSCVDAANSTVATAGPGQATVTIPASAVAPGAKLFCTFENTYEPKLQVSKTADKTGAKPGETVLYTVQMSNTAGSAANVVFTDTLSPYAALVLDSGNGTPFQFADGTNPSGLSLGTPLYSHDHGANWTTDVATSGTDATITDWKIPMVGTMNGSSSGTPPFPSFTIKYRVVVK